MGNKKQYALNNSGADKIQVALTTTDEQQRTATLNEGKRLLNERNKHIVLAEKFGWDTVECYESVAADAERIRKAVKESKRIRDEKKKELGPCTTIKRLLTCKKALLTEHCFHAMRAFGGKDGCNLYCPFTCPIASVCFRCLDPAISQGIVDQLFQEQ